MCKRFLFFLLVLAIYSCKQEVVRPDIPEDRLIELLADLHMIEMAMHQVPKHSKDSMALFYRNQILEIYQLSEDSLERNIEVLQEDPNYYYEISKKVAELTKKEKQDFTDKSIKEKK